LPVFASSSSLSARNSGRELKRYWSPFTWANSAFWTRRRIAFFVSSSSSAFVGTEIAASGRWFYHKAADRDEREGGERQGSIATRERRRFAALC
jgi:hypothetical protein